MRVLAELCLPFARPGGAWIALKGPDPEASTLQLPSAPLCINYQQPKWSRLACNAWMQSIMEACRCLRACTNWEVMQAEVAAAAAAIKLLGGSRPRIELMQSFAQHGQRNAVVVQKQARTPRAYPRKEGLPKKLPL